MAKVRSHLIVLLAVALLIMNATCARLPRNTHSDSLFHLDPPKVETGLRININTASPQELEKLPGVGKVIAERIVAHRAQYGAFRRVEHLMMVRGISDRKFRAMRSMIAVE